MNHVLEHVAFPTRCFLFEIIMYINTLLKATLLLAGYATRCCKHLKGSVIMHTSNVGVWGVCEGGGLKMSIKIEVRSSLGSVGVIFLDFVIILLLVLSISSRFAFFGGPHPLHTPLNTCNFLYTLSLA